MHTTWIPFVLAYVLLIVCAVCFIWDLYDLYDSCGTNSVSEYIRSHWVAWPAGISIGLLVASHFIRWPWN